MPAPSELLLPLGMAVAAGLVGSVAVMRRMTLASDAISHELNLVYRYADNVLCLSRAAACFGPPIDVLTTERLQEMYGAEVRFHDHAHGHARH